MYFLNLGVKGLNKSIEREDDFMAVVLLCSNRCLKIGVTARQKIEITSWEVRAYGIYARVCLVSRNERASRERVSFVKTNKLVRKYRTKALPML